MGVTSLTAQKHKQNLSVKPNKIYSLENDKRHEKELMQQERLRFAPKFNAEQVRKNLKSTDVQERLGAVETAGYFPESNLTAEVENLLITDYSVEVRQQCAQTLQMIGDKNSIPTLVVALKDSDRNVRIFSTLALASLGEKEESSVAVKELWNNGSNNAPFYSCHFIFRDLATTEAINCLSADLNNADKFVAVDAAITLAQIGQSAKAFPFLQQVLTDNDQYIRMAALRGLAYIGDAVSLGLIQTRINDESNLVSEQSMSILKNFTNNSINQ
ncbi:hypothetical protein FACS189434_08490 [Bacteroidia bacterium]|nr:hypothetical protein FACS189434_08490 [Bacteroidia bacterium]